MATVTENKTLELPEYLQSGLQDVVTKAGELVNTAQYQPYTGLRVAAQDPLSEAAYLNLSQFTPASQLGQATGIAGAAAQQAANINYTPAQATNYYNAPTFNPMGTTYRDVATSPLQQYQMEGGIPDILTERLRTYQTEAPADVTTSDFNREAAQRYMSPYIQDVIEQQKQGAVRDYARSLPTLGAATARAGGLGGTRGALLQAEGQRNLFDRLSGIQTQGLQNAYQQAQQQFNTDASRQAQVGLANQQTRLSVAQRNVDALNAAGQFEEAQRLQAQINNQQSRMQVAQQNLAARLGVQSLGANLGLQSQQSNQQAQLQAQQQAMSQNLAYNQFAQQNAASAAQYGLAGANLAEQSNQFGANLGLQGLQMSLQGAGVLSNIGQNAYEQAMGITGAQLQAGGAQQAMEQARLDQQYQDFLAQQQFPYQQLQFYSNILGATPYGGSQTTTTQVPSSNNTAQYIGMGLAGIGALLG